MRAKSFIITAIAAIATVAMLGGCEDNTLSPEDIQKKENTGPLTDISGTIGDVSARIPDPESRYGWIGHVFKFSELDTDNYTIHMIVEKIVDGEPIVHDIASAAVSKDGSFKLQMPTTLKPEWLTNISAEMEQLFNDSNRYAGIEGMWNDLPEEVKISDPKVDACVAKLYIERESDGLIYDVYFGGPDKESYHATDLSFVGESYLLYTTAAVEVSGRTEFKWAIPYNGEYLHHGEPRGFDINSPGGWNWTHVIANGLSEYIGWSTAWPDWAIMEWSAHAIYDE